jgi:hypothetical protein
MTGRLKTSSLLHPPLRPRKRADQDWLFGRGAAEQASDLQADGADEGGAATQLGRVFGAGELELTG